MRLTFASYNIHKAVGRDRRYDPERVLTVLRELGADVVALQEADRRYGRRESVLPRQMLDEHHWQVVPIAMRPASIGWHGNAILVRRGLDIIDGDRMTLPMLEPRGSVRAGLACAGRRFEVVGMHLDLSGMVRRRQVATVCSAITRMGAPAVLMGDLNEWSPTRGALAAFGSPWNVLMPGKSFPSGRPLAALDRIVHSSQWQCDRTWVHHSAAAALASDHLPVLAKLSWMAD